MVMQPFSLQVVVQTVHWAGTGKATVVAARTAATNSIVFMGNLQM